MAYDDDTGTRVHLDLRVEERPPERGTPPRPPTKHVRDLILDHVRRHRDWKAERIHAHFRKIHKRHDIALPVVRLVMTQENAKQRG